MRGAALVLLGVLLGVALVGCGSGGDGVSQGERQAALREARAGMNSVRALPGGKQATFEKVRLVGSDTVCGTIDGNDGFGARAFSTTGGVVTLADPHDAGSRAKVSAACTGRPAREITSRNEQFSDIDLAE